MLNQKNKILYIANIRFPTERAHGIQIAKTCESLGKVSDLTVFVPERKNSIKENPFDYYQIKKSFKIEYIKIPKFIINNYFLSSLYFSEIAAIKMWKIKPDFVYSRDWFILFNMILLGKKLVWEVHEGRVNIFVKILLKKLYRFISISQGLVDAYIKIGLQPKKAKVVRDAAFFENVPDKDECRHILNIDKDKKIILYNGSLHGWKGVDTFFKASNILTSYDFFCVGGKEKDIERLKLEFPKINFFGQKPFSQVPLYITAADVCVVPNSDKFEISSKFTSPMKLFEYMALGAVIVASDLPSFREVVSHDQVFFFKPDDVQDLSEKIRLAISNPEISNKKVNSSLLLAKEYTWQKRAENIIKALA